MKKVITIIGIFGLILVQAQVGINTDTPQATLDIQSATTRALDIGDYGAITNFHITRHGRIFHGNSDFTGSKHIINLHSKYARFITGINMKAYDGPMAGASMSIQASDGVGRIISDKSIYMFIDSDNNTREAVFAIYKDYEGNYGHGNLLFGFHENGQAYKAGGGTWTALSDKRSKENIVNFTKGLKELLQVRPVNFKYKKEFAVANKTYTGVIAQELEKIAPSMVSETERGNIKDFKTVDPNEFTYMLINAVKELKQQNDKQQKEIDELKTLVKELQLKIK